MEAPVDRVARGDSQLEELLQGQRRLEHTINDMKSWLERLPEVLRSTSGFKSDAGDRDTGFYPSEGDLAQEGKMLKSSTRRKQRRGFTVDLSELELELQPLPAFAEVHEDLVTMVAEELSASNEDPTAGELQHPMFASCHQSTIGGENKAKSKWSPSMPSWQVIHPAAGINSLFDASRAVFLLVDLVVIPYSMAWEVKVEGAFYWLSWLVFAFWTTDMTLNFCTGYIKDGAAVLDWRQVALHYVKHGFVVDFVVVSVELIDLIAASVGSTINTGTLLFLKILRFFKITRLVRIAAKLRAGLLERIHTATVYWTERYGLVAVHHNLGFAALIVKLMLVVSWLAHMGACIWYTVGRSSLVDGSSTWQDSYTGNVSSYMRGLYWSTSTMFSGSSHTNPENEAELALSVMWIVLGALYVTCITSLLAASLISNYEKKQEMFKKMQMLTTFLAQRRTPVLLSLAVQADFHRKLLEQDVVTELDLPSLSRVSPGLRSALRESQYTEACLALPFFRMLAAVRPTIVTGICFAMSSFSVHRSGEKLFEARQLEDRAILLARGQLGYIKVNCAAPDSRARSMQSLRPTPTGSVHPGAWICELALVVQWRTRGTMEVDVTSELLEVSAEEFQKVILSDTTLAALVSDYALQVCNLHSSDHELWSHCSDIDTSFDFDIVVSAMHKSIRTFLVSYPVLDQLATHHNTTNIGTLHLPQLPAMPRRKREFMTNVQEDLSGGWAHMFMGPAGPSSAYMVVRIVTLQLLNKDGALCVQLAEYKDNQASPKFRLPGCRVLANETPQSAFQRLLQEKMHELAPAVHVVDVRTEVTQEVSSKTGLITKYIKTKYLAELCGSMVAGVIADGASIVSGARPSADVPVKSSGSSVLASLPQPILSLEGTHHSFAMMQLRLRATSSSYHSYSIGSAERRHNSLFPGLPQVGHRFSSSSRSANSSEVIPPGAIVRVYQWWPKAAYTDLEPRRADVERELAPTLQTLPSMSWRRMLDFRLKQDANGNVSSSIALFVMGEDLSQQQVSSV